MGHNPTVEAIKSCSNTRRKLWLGSKDRRLVGTPKRSTGEDQNISWWQSTWWGKTNSVEEGRNSVGDKNTLQQTQLGKKKEAPLGIEHSAEELNQHKRLGIPKELTAWGTSDASHLRTCFITEMLLIFLLLVLEKFLLLYIKEKWFWF